MKKVEEKTKILDNSIDECEKVLVAEYSKIAQEMGKELKALYYKMGTQNGPVPHSELYKFNRYYDILNNLQSTLRKLGQIEVNVIEDRFIKLYKNSSTYPMFNPVIDTPLIRDVVNEPWGERAEVWSNRIWKHKAATAERLQKDIINCLTTGKSWEKLSHQLSIDLTVDFNSAMRLIRTEMVRISTQSTIDDCKRLGIDKVKVIVWHDDKTCVESCAEHDGQVLYARDAEPGVNVPPFHPNCRCYIVAVH